MIELDCSVGEGGGGILRAALPLSMVLQSPIHFTRFRIERPEKGIGWPHKWLVDGICRWTKSRAKNIELGESDFVFEPGSLDFSGSQTWNFDDPGVTSEFLNVSVVRKYDEASDNFLQPMNNIGGKAARGHSIVTPLLAIIPIMLHSKQHCITANMIGGTETPGAPFIDALQFYFMVPLKEIGASMSLKVHKRGCIGIGGGRVQVDAAPAAKLLPFQQIPNTDGTDKPSLSVFMYIYGSPKYHEEALDKYTLFIEKLSCFLGINININYTFIPYVVNKYQQLFILRNGASVRDISICFEEIEETERANFGMALASRRLEKELQYSHLMSRFAVEQFLPVAATIPETSTFLTDGITDHAQSIIDVVATISGRKVRIEKLPSFGFQITV